MDKTYQTLKSANSLPTPPGVAIRILALVQSEATSIEDIAEVMQADPALTSKVMKFISSPVMGLGFRGTTVAEAVARIGMRGAQMMALSFSLVSQKHRGNCPGFDFDCFWSESLGRAVAARRLAQHLRGWDAEEAFVTGLLARIGKLVLATGMGKEYDPILCGTVYPELSLEAREHTVLETNHLEVGRQLLRDWNLPEIVWKTTGLLAENQERESRSARLIEVADTIANFLVDDSRHTAADIELLAKMAEERLEIEPDEFRSILGNIGQDWIGYGQLLSVQTSPVPDLEQIEAQVEDQRTVLRVASEIEVQSLRMENVQLGRLARRDRLTGLLNRASFDEALPVALATASESGRPLTLLMIDADHFKSVNDAHGHRTGDAVLEHLSRLFDDNVRRRDQVFRYGGEEFAILAPDCPLQNATELAEIIREVVEAAPFVGSGATIPLTVSIGIACTEGPDSPVSAPDLVDYADERLYDAKRDGRNRWKHLPPGRSGARWWMKIGRILSRSPR